LWLTGRLTPRAGLARERVGLVGGADTGSATFFPLKPVPKRTSAVGEGLVVATVTVFEYASVHPGHFLCAVQRSQRPPQFLIEQHRGITAIADHCAAQGPNVIASRGW
jgi:hypothetical protein